MPARAERHIVGEGVSAGLVIGPAAVVTRPARQRAASGDPAAEAAALREAIAATILSIEAQADLCDDEGAEILRLQAELLRDDTLSGPAFAAIEAGLSAELAWSRALDAEIRDYEAADDGHFRARASDLRDLATRTLDHLIGEVPAFRPPPGAVVVADDLPPSVFLAMDWSAGGGVVLTAGSPVSHVAILAKSRGIPMIVGVGGAPEVFEGEVLVDGGAGAAILHAEPRTLADFRRRAGRAAVTQPLAATAPGGPLRDRDGRDIRVQINVSDPSDVAGLAPEACDGVGLVRTEFLFHGAGLPDEDHQYEAYAALVAWAKGLPVTVRTLDAGGDKQIPGVSTPAESNPFLGMRGIRLSLVDERLFRTQLRALARAAALGDLRIMLPMVTTPGELATARAILAEEHAALVRAGKAAVLPPLGIMVEVPAAALAIERFDADFFSIGSNDLVQYVTASARDIHAVAHLADPLHPAVLGLFARVATHGAATGREVCICGEVASDPSAIASLLATGLTNFSVPPSAIARTKAAIRAATASK